MTLDPLEACGDKLFQRREAQGGGADAETVQQHQGMAAGIAAQHEAAGLARTAIADDFDARLALQQFRQGGLPG
jgi:hypothetical protein